MIFAKLLTLEDNLLELINDDHPEYERRRRHGDHGEFAESLN
jgi:hypothetical protein